MKRKRAMITPGSVLRLKAIPLLADLWKAKIARCCRVGFYSRMDGDDIVWLVDEFGDYCETIDLTKVNKYFEILVLSSNQDFYGDRSDPLAALVLDGANSDFRWSSP